MDWRAARCPLISPISAPAAGPFPPQISPEGISQVPPTQLGPAPAAELPRGSEFVPGLESHQIWLAATNRLRAALGAMRGRLSALCRLDSQDLPPKGQVQHSSSRDKMSY